jgi:hypothetical protein
MRNLLAAIAALLLLGSPALAGTIDLAWDPVNGADGYRIYYGLTPEMTLVHVVGPVTAVSLTGLDDCATYYVAVKALRTNGVEIESVEFSNVVTGWARPIVGSADPLTPGTVPTIAVEGMNFLAGALVLIPSRPDLTVVQTVVNSCTSLSVSIDVPADAPAGTADLLVSNPDLTFGALVGGIEVLGPPEAPDQVLNFRLDNLIDPPAGEMPVAPRVVSVASGQPYTVATAALGVDVYVDGPAPLELLAAEFDGWWLIQSANADRDSTEDEFLTLDLAGPGRVVVAHHDRIGVKPPWLAGLTPLGLNVTADGEIYSLYEEFDPPVSIILGGNLQAAGISNRVMYFVLVEPLAP